MYTKCISEYLDLNEYNQYECQAHHRFFMIRNSKSMNELIFELGVNYSML